MNGRGRLALLSGTTESNPYGLWARDLLLHGECSRLYERHSQKYTFADLLFADYKNN